MSAASATDSQAEHHKKPTNHQVTTEQPVLGVPSQEQPAPSLTRGSTCGTQLSTRTLRCLNRKISRLENALNGLYSSQRVVAVNQFGEDTAGGAYGYNWTDNTLVPPDQWLTTALDLREPDDTTAPDFWSVVWVCEVQP
jgi:hypothetical protein